MDLLGQVLEGEDRGWVDFAMHWRGISLLSGRGEAGEVEKVH